MTETRKTSPFAVVAMEQELYAARLELEGLRADVRRLVAEIEAGEHGLDMDSSVVQELREMIGEG